MSCHLLSYFFKKDYFCHKLNIMDKRKQIFFWIVIAVVTLGMASRVFGISANISPMLAVLLIGAAYFHKKGLALIIPIGLYFIADLYLNNVVYAAYFDGFQLLGSVGVYMSLIIIIPIAIFTLRKVSIASVLISSIGAAVIFFLVTNFFSMLTLPQYTKDFAGLINSYEAAIPFFRSTLVSTVVYSAVLFTAAELYLRQPQLDSSTKNNTTTANS